MVVAERAWAPMSKPVRIKDYLAAELEKIAARENRSLHNLVNHLLEQAIELEGRRARAEPPAPDPALRKQLTADGAQVSADSQARDVQSRTLVPPPVQDTFKPDPKPERKKK